MDVDKITHALSPEIVENFKLAIEIGKWPDGKKLTPEQLETCMQAVIAYEHRFMKENERTGYVPPKTTPCGPKDDTETTEVKWKN